MNGLRVPPAENIKFNFACRILLSGTLNGYNSITTSFVCYYLFYMYTAVAQWYYIMLVYHNTRFNPIIIMFIYLFLNLN